MQKVLKAGAYLLLIVFIFMVVGFGWLRSSLPKLDGSVSLDGISAEVSIVRDDHGVPHITATSKNDLMFGLGYVHAQDRLWQMEMNRRIGTGRLAEAVGVSGLGVDRLFRTLNFAGKAQEAYKNLPKSGQDALLSYADGVNAYLANHKGALPSEYILTGITPEPWQPMHSMVWLKMMSYDLGGNMRHELARAELMQKFTPEQVAELYPTYPGDPAEIPLPDFKSLLAGLPIKELAELSPEKPAGYGSNNWVISGENTASGSPILANDPHLTLRTPSIWYLAHLRLERPDGKVFNQVGTTLPSVPMVVLGRNDTIAWGFTNTAPDVQDLFIERVMGDDGNQYQTPDGIAYFIFRNEIIKVKDSDDVILKVRETRHGPVVSDIYKSLKPDLKEEYVLALQWTALLDRDTNILTGLDLIEVTDFEGFVKAAGNFVSPEQNMVFADISGNIGYYAPGVVPIRRADNLINGRLPSPGWDALYDWQGTIPLDELPKRFNPEGGIIATANEKIVDADYPHYITRDWSLPYRGNRIRALLGAKKDHDLASIAEVQYDTVSDMARELLPLMLDASMGMPDDIRSAMNAWNGDMAIDSAEALIFANWWRHLNREVTADELGDMLPRHTKQRPSFIKNVLTDLDGQSRWCDDITTTQREGCSVPVDKAFDLTLTELTSAYGSSWENWRWGDQHILTQDHTPFGQVPSLSPYFSLSEEQGGGSYTINVAGNRYSTGKEHSSGFGPSYRGLFDLSNLENSLYLQPTGQSGNIFSDHYGDMFPRWRNGDYFKIEGDKAVPTNAAHTLTLTPRVHE